MTILLDPQRDSRTYSQPLAQLCHISSRQLERYFHEENGRTPQTWLNDMRLRQAAGLLLEGYQVKQIAFELGFAHSSHFIRKFKRLHGCTPLTFVRWVRTHGTADTVAAGAIRRS